MSKSETITIYRGLLIFIGIILVAAVLSYLIDRTLRYSQITNVIEKCNSDFGEGNWSFIETNEAYICHAVSSTQVITTSSTKSCFQNNIPIDCKEIE